MTEITVYDSSLNRLAILNNIIECKVTHVLNAEYTMELTVTDSKLKTQYLYDSTNILAIDNEYYNVFKVTSSHDLENGVLISCQCEQIGYKTILKTFENGFNHTGTVQEIGQLACQGTGFTFTSTIQGQFTVTLQGLTNARQVLTSLCDKTSGEIKWDKFNISIESDIGQNTIYCEVGLGCTAIRKITDYSTNKETYEVDLINHNDHSLGELRKAHIGDTVILNSARLGVNGVQKKIIRLVDNKVDRSVSDIEDYTVESFDRNMPTEITLGDAEVGIIDELEKIFGESDVNVEVVEEITTATEVAHINNCWTKNLNVEYLETNFSAMDTRQPYTQFRNYIRIFDNCIEFHVAEMSPTLTEYLTTVDGDHVYWTAINTAEQAYKYFTLTSPLVRYPDLTETEVNAFRVQVRKTIKDDIKKKEVITQVGEDFAPVEILGIGNGTQASQDYQFLEGINLMQNQAVVLKDAKGYLIEYYKTDGGKAWIRIGDDGIEMSHSALKSIDFYLDGFKVNGNCKFKWVSGGLLKDDGELIRITESNQNIVMEDED